MANTAANSQSLLESLSKRPLTRDSTSLIKSRVSKIIIYKLDRKREKFIEKFPSLFP